MTNHLASRSRIHLGRSHMELLDGTLHRCEKAAGAACNSPGSHIHDPTFHVKFSTGHNHGSPLHGQTTLGRELDRRTNLPFISRDDLKESLFDSLGWDDRDWSKKLGVASFHLLYRVIESILRTGQSIIVETNFSPEFDTGRFLALKQEYGFYPIQILCRTDREVLFEKIQNKVRIG